MLQAAGGFDPVLGGLTFRYTSNAPFTGVHDPTLDAMITKATETFPLAQRDKEFRQIWKYISDQAYSPFLYAARSTQRTGTASTTPSLCSGRMSG